MAASGGHGMLRKSGHNMGKITLHLDVLGMEVLQHAAVPSEPLSDVISICYILGFRKDNAKFFSKLSLNHWRF